MMFLAKWRSFMFRMFATDKRTSSRDIVAGQPDHEWVRIPPLSKLRRPAQSGWTGPLALRISGETHLVEVLLLPLADAGVHLVHEVVADLEVQLTALIGLDQGAFPGGLRGAILGTCHVTREGGGGNGVKHSTKHTINTCMG